MSLKQPSTGKVLTVNLHPLGLGREYEPSQEEWQKVARELGQTLAQSGCAYLTHHTITQDQINSLVASTTTFFNLDQDTKDRYGADAGGGMGYVGVGGESYTETKELEIHERYNFAPDTKVPDAEVPTMRPALASFVTSCSDLVTAILRLLSLDLDEDPAKLLAMHKGRYSGDGMTCTRLNYYPPVPDTVFGNAIRFGVHRDFGTFALLYQDDVGGLQVQDKSGSWLDIDPVPDTIFIFVADILEAYSKNKYFVPVHRAIIPKEEIKRRSSRISIAHFLGPDKDALLPFTPEGASASDPPMTFKQYCDFMLRKVRT